MTVALPGSPANGNVVVLVMVSFGTAPALPTHFTDFSSAQTTVFASQWATGQPFSWTIPLGGAEGTWLAFEFAGLSGLPAAVATASTQTTGTTKATPSITPTVDSLILGIGRHALSGTPVTASSVSGSWTLSQNSGVTSVAGGYNMGMSSAYIEASSGAQTTTFTYSVTADNITDSIAFPVSTGGTAYTIAPADSVGITDSGTFAITTAQAYILNAADSIGIIDTGQPQALGYGTHFADPVGITDALVASAGRIIAASDAVGLTDTFTEAVSFTVLPAGADSMGISDVATFVLSSGGIDYELTVDDLIGISEAVKTVNAGPPRDVTITLTTGPDRWSVTTTSQS